MLKITETNEVEGRALLALEGRLVGTWVDELVNACRKHLGSGNHLILDLSGVSFVDAGGIGTLRELQRKGAVLERPSLYLQALLDRHAPKA